MVTFNLLPNWRMHVMRATLYQYVVMFVSVSVVAIALSIACHWILVSKIEQVHQSILQITSKLKRDQGNPLDQLKIGHESIWLKQQIAVTQSTRMFIFYLNALKQYHMCVDGISRVGPKIMLSGVGLSKTLIMQYLNALEKEKQIDSIELRSMKEVERQAGTRFDLLMLPTIKSP